MQDNQENREIRGGVADFTMIRLPSDSADSIKSLFSILILSYNYMSSLHMSGYVIQAENFNCWYKHRKRNFRAINDHTTVQ